MVTFDGPDGVNTFVAIVLRRGITLWAEHRIKPSRLWTAKAMLAKAEKITGQKFKRGEYQKAIDALTSWIEINGTTGERR